MLGKIKDWWRTRQVIKIGTAEVNRFNSELSECRKIIISAADEDIGRLKKELEALRSDADFDIDLCRDVWKSWHEEGDATVEIFRGAVHQRLSQFTDFATVMGIESEMKAIVDQAVDESKAYYLLGGADTYAKFAAAEGPILVDA